MNTGIPGPEEREQIYNNLNAKYGGSNQSGKLFLTYIKNIKVCYDYLSNHFDYFLLEETFFKKRFKNLSVY